MHDIGYLVDNVEKYKNAIIQKKYFSKKNTVAYVILNKKPVVLKWFAPGFKNNMQNEFSILRNLPSSINTPNIIEKDEENNVLVISHIFGKNLCDVINDENILISIKQNLMMYLSKWFYKFHSYFHENKNYRIRGDSILRNFILTNRIWGLDFEESRLGKPVEDIAAMCCSILSTEPMFKNWKFQLSKIFINSYNDYSNLKLSDINEQISYSLLEKIQYRPDDEMIFRKYSERISNIGL